jgi:photosystem I subunit XII
LREQPKLAGEKCDIWREKRLRACAGSDRGLWVRLWAFLLHDVTIPSEKGKLWLKLRGNHVERLGSLPTMALSDMQKYAALAIALVPGILAIRLATELYK